MEKLQVIKIGGNIVDNKDVLDKFLSAYAKIEGNKILVHGGGKIATYISDKLGIKTQMIEGRRVTDNETIDVVTMVYAGLINKKIVARLQSLSCNAIGFSGADANIITATKRPATPIDYGFVGDLKSESVNTEAIINFLNMKLSPIFCAINHDGNGLLLNTNADTVVSTIATSLAHKFNVSLVYVFEKPGVLMDINNNTSVISNINKESFIDLKTQGIISDGMIPKVENALKAIDKGVNEVIITNPEYFTEGSEFKTTIS